MPTALVLNIVVALYAATTMTMVMNFISPLILAGILEPSFFTRLYYSFSTALVYGYIGSIIAGCETSLKEWIYLVGVVLLVGILFNWWKKRNTNETVHDLKDRLAQRMEDANAQGYYEASVTSFRYNSFDYEPVFSLTQDTEQSLKLMNELVAFKVLEIEDGQLPIYHPINLDCYFDSWKMMSLTEFEGKVSRDDHFFAIHLAIGKYFVEEHGFGWQRKGSQYVLLHESEQIEIDTLETIANALKKNATDFFVAIEEAYLSNKNSGLALRIY